MSQKTERIEFRSSEDFKAILEEVTKALNSSQGEVLEHAFKFWLMKYYKFFDSLPEARKQKIKTEFFNLHKVASR